MSLNFDIFYNFFVFCGDIVGQVSSLSLMPYGDALRIIFAITNNTSLTYVNLFTGVTQSFIKFPFNGGNIVYEWLINNLVPASPDTPLVLALIYTIFVYGIGFTIFKWVIDIIF